MPTKSAKPPARIDRLQPLVVARAAKLGLTAYAIAAGSAAGKRVE